MNGLPPPSHSQPAHKMYTAGSLELHRGVEIQLCNTHKHRNIYQLCVKPLSTCLGGLGTFIACLPSTGNYNATFTLSSGTLGRFSHGLRLTTLVLYGTLTCRPKLEEGLWMSILFTTIFTALSRYFRSLASPNFENILSQKITILSRIIFSNLPNFLYF